MLLECEDDLNAGDSGDDDSIDEIKKRLQPTTLLTRHAILQMIPNAKYELLRLPRDIHYPLVISVSIRRWIDLFVHICIAFVNVDFNY